LRRACFATIFSEKERENGEAEEEMEELLATVLARKEDKEKRRKGEVKEGDKEQGKTR